MKNRTKEELINSINKKFPEFSESGWKIVGDYIDSNTNILVSGIYGKCLVKPKHLLNRHMPTIMSAINPHEYFINKLLNSNKYFRNGEFEIIGEYINAKQKIEIFTKYGNCMVLPDNLLQGQKPSVESAINKNEFWKNYAEEILGYNYDYSKINYVNDKEKLEITCPKHGSFWQRPYNHIRGNQCPKCRPNSITLQDWLKVQSDNPGIFYVLRCWNDEEEFYKVGITAEKSVDRRYNSKDKMPYQYEVIYQFNNIDRNLIWGMEDRFKRQFNDYVYQPSIKFGGSMTECFLNFDFIYSEEYYNHDLDIGNIVKYENELYVVIGKSPKWRNQEPYTIIENKPEKENINVQKESVIIEKLSDSPFENGKKFVRWIPRFHSKGIIKITEPTPIGDEDDFYEEENDSW